MNPIVKDLVQSYIRKAMIALATYLTTRLSVDPTQSGKIVDGLGALLLAGATFFWQHRSWLTAHNKLAAAVATGAAKAEGLMQSTQAPKP